NVQLRYRKVGVMTVFYVLAVFLINTLGYIGPGVFYLLFNTVLAALIFPIRYAYFSVVSNVILLVIFACIIAFQLFYSVLITEYSVGKWIAFSANLVFASIVIVLLIDKIFQGLQFKITNKTQLQERYQQIFYKSPLPMWLFDTDNFMFLDVNEAALNNYGYTKAEFLNMSIMDIRPSESIAQTEELVRANKISGEYYGGVSQHLTKNRELIYVQIESNLLHLDGRQVRLVQATDITTQLEHQLEVYEANRRVNESESNLRALFDSAIDGFVLLDEKCIIKLFNPKASEAMKFNRDQNSFEAGRSIFDYVETSRLSYFREIIAKVYQGETVDYDRMFRTGGAVSWIRYTLTPVREAERVVGASITGRDVTARKLYLRSVEEQNKTFREISWAQSHLVRAPLARIMGLLPMLPNAANDAERDEILGYLRLSANELDGIIAQITEKSTRIIKKYANQKSEN
ncbi:PAS domain-containing protein, partial [Mucilaginibacter sp.]|uniref:PAS domain-containing protein n=1 Tax=Mucilaginibacter sp. TaxID=1882438 RepID=UPI0035BBB590